MSVCVIIPTCNRFQELRRTLSGLAGQTVRPERVIVIDDGSPDAVFGEMDAFCRTLDLPITLLKNAPKKGPAAARNTGILQARETSLLFINDDTYPVNGTFIEFHVEWAARYPESIIVGKLEWAPETPNALLFGKWTRRMGFDVGYADMNEGETVGYHKFCTANVLVPRHFLTETLFDEQFPYAAYEDVELGFRLTQQGRTLRYNPHACVYHYHRYMPELVIDRQRKAGASFAYLLSIHPELATPKIPCWLTVILKMFLKTSFVKFCSQDFQLFLQELTAKYVAFWQAYPHQSHVKR